MIIRPAKKEDVPRIFYLIQELAEYERLNHEFTGNMVDLESHLFGDRCFLESFVAEVKREVVGYSMYFYNYSTFITKPGIYLEDLFVLPHHRNNGIGRALLDALVRKAKEIGAGRIDWSVLDWNVPAIQFYQSLGAKILPDWRICRMTGKDLESYFVTTTHK